MNTFSMTCSCGDTMSVDADTREEAVMKMKEMMSQTAIDAHCAEKHPGMTLTQDQVYAQIDEKLAPM